MNQNLPAHSNRQDDVASSCAGFVAQAGRAIDWINDPRNAEKAGDQRQGLERRFRRSIRRAGKLEAAAKSNMAVSVFGPSQNGKSFLVSVLARPHGADLVTAFDDPEGQQSYVGAINPPGGGESTGLVTRFSMTRPVTPPGFAVALSLMSVADLAQTIANSFFEDGDNLEPPPEPAALAAHLERFATRAGAARGAIDADGVWEIADYIERKFASRAYARELRGFWADAATVAPQLGMADLGPFLSIIWGGHHEFTRIFTALAQGLERIGFAGRAFAPMAALIPRATSIIDVAQLRRIGTGEPDPLALKLPGGQETTLDRAVLCALTAEFVLPMRDLPDPMFRQTDLLDFPGARNRFSKPLEKTFKAQDEGIGQLLLRGKVAYLFDRYVEDQKINAMLLCIKDSNMDTTDLPGLIETWVAMTQGATPEQRAQNDCILFFLLTFFDIHLADTAGGAGDTERFDKRLFQSISEKFGSSGWVENWAGGRKFNNTFWIRNPNYPIESIFDYNKSQNPAIETGLREDKAPRMAELKEGYLKSQLVRTHFADPAAAWDAAMTLNDGGVSYLRSHLQPVCNIGRKLDQIDSQLAVLEREVIAALEPMHISDDLDLRLRDKEAAANRVIDGLEQALANRSFAELMSALMVDQDQMFDRMSRVPMNIRISNAVRSAAPGERPVATSIRPGSGSMRPGRPNAAAGGGSGETTASFPAPATDATDPGAETIRTMSRAAFQAETAMRLWAETLDRLKDDPRLHRQFGLTPETAASLSAEILHAARRLHLEQKIRDRFEQSGFGLRLEGQARPASVLATEAINRFVSSLGTMDLPEADRPRAGDGPDAGAVFAARKVVDDVTDLPAEPRPTLEESWRDWVFALFDLYRANAMHLSGSDVDPEMNGRLGDILRRLRHDGDAA